MNIEQRDQYEEIQERDQSMKRPTISNTGTGLGRLEISFDVESYVHVQH